MSRKEAIRGLTVDLNVFEAGSLQFSLLAKRRRDIDLEDSGGMLFQPVATEKPSLSDIHRPIHEPETIGGKKAMQRRSVVGTEGQRPHRFEDAMHLAETEGPFGFRIDAVDPIEGKKNIIQALAREQEFTSIHDSEINALNQLSGFLDHLWDQVDPCDGMAHSLEKKTRSSATAADVQDAPRRLKMDPENPFFHGEKIKLTVLLQSLLAGKGFLVPQFLLGEIHRPRFPDLVVQDILQGFCTFLKEFLGKPRVKAHQKRLRGSKADL
jgi:hypothetical protein